MGTEKRIVAAIDDVFFMAKVKDAAVAAGLGIEFARSFEDTILRSAAGGCLVVIDLNAGTYRPVELITALAGTPTLGFLSHVNVELKLKAEEAGAGRVVARSALAQNINAIFREFAAEKADGRLSPPA